MTKDQCEVLGITGILPLDHTYILAPGTSIEKARAAIEGMTLSDYLLTEMRHSAERPSVRELRERLSKRRAISPKVPPAEAVRHERDLH